MTLHPDWTERFAGINRLYGKGALEQFQSSHIAVIGIGGVGTWVVEALARSGIGRFTLVDADDVCVSNSNRQLHALDGHFGQNKVALMAERVRAISPQCQVDEIQDFLTPTNLSEILSRGYDLVIDACDSFRVKVEMIVYCRRNKIPLIVSGSAGGRTDPSKITIKDLSRTEHDAMLSLIRKKLRNEYQFPRNKERYFGVQAVFSLENVRYPHPDGTVSGIRPTACDALKLDCGEGLGAATHLTASFGMAAAAKTLEKLLTQKPKDNRKYCSPSEG